MIFSSSKKVISFTQSKEKHHDKFLLEIQHYDRIISTRSQSVSENGYGGVDDSGSLTLSTIKLHILTLIFFISSGPIVPMKRNDQKKGKISVGLQYCYKEFSFVSSRDANEVLKCP
jgi:hypothetical protein